MRPLSRREKGEYRQEEYDQVEKTVERNWNRPQWMKRNTPEAKRKHKEKTRWRLKMLKDRAKAKGEAKGATGDPTPEDHRRGSFRPPPVGQGGRDAEAPNRKMLARETAEELAWSRSQVKKLSGQLDLAEDEAEAARLEEMINLEKAKQKSLATSEDEPEMVSVTASSSRGPAEPNPDMEEYEEALVEDEPEEFEDVPVEEETGEYEDVPIDEDFDLTNPQSVLSELGFTSEEAEMLVNEFGFGSGGDEAPDVDSLELMSVDQPESGEGWEKIYVTVDSGAAVTCFPEELLTGYALGEHHGPENYTSASNHQVKALGIAMPVVGFEDWVVNRITTTVLTPLKKPLLSTHEMVQNGWRVVHDDEENGGSYALHRATGRKLKIYAMGGVYKMPLWIRRKGFGRQGQVL